MPVRALDHSRIGVGKFLHRRWQIPAPALANSCTGVGLFPHRRWFVMFRRFTSTPPNTTIPLTAATTAPLSIKEKQNSFLPKSLNEAPNV